MRYLGIDYGTKRVGVALSDEAGVMGFPHAVMANDRRLMDELAHLIKERAIGAIVVGESLNYQGQENAVMEAARAFAEELAARTGAELHFEPEMLTTQEAKRDGEGVHHSRRVVDSSAAALILTSFLSRA
ncbi:MAG TPA: Holliday junction resolvase RuvX [Candidatus Paceibacterota bacterium]|nr:Holliday junction resolvase RuvX [Candidatus Paceibacterota bacterium]